MQNTRRLQVKKLVDYQAPGVTLPKKRAIVAADMPEPPWFRAVLSPFEEQGDEACVIGVRAAGALGIEVGSEPWVLPLE